MPRESLPERPRSGGRHRAENQNAGRATGSDRPAEDASSAEIGEPDGFSWENWERKPSERLRVSLKLPTTLWTEITRAAKNRAIYAVMTDIMRPTVDQIRLQGPGLLHHYVPRHKMENVIPCAFDIERSLWADAKWAATKYDLKLPELVMALATLYLAGLAASPGGAQNNDAAA